MPSAFVSAVAEVAGAAPADAQRVIDATLDAIQRTLAEGGEVSFPGFGKFSTGARAARSGRNPRTGAPMEIPATTYARFTPGTGLRAAVRDATPAAPARRAAPVGSPSTPVSEPPVSRKAKTPKAAAPDKPKKKGKKSKKK